MSNSKKAVLVVDGLPPSGKADLFIKKLNASFDVFYVSFATDIYDINHESISALLKKAIKDILSNHHSFSVVAISFGGYVIAHSNDILSQYSSVIEKITLYSPAARMKKVVGIETLSSYLREQYPKLNVSTEGLMRLDYEMPTANLLDGDLVKTVHIILGSNDLQLPINFQKEYFRRYNTDVTDEGHIGISSLMIRDDSEWM